MQDRPVQLEADIESRDRYGCRLAYVIVDGDRFNDELLRRGYARLLVIEPNHARTSRVSVCDQLAAWPECHWQPATIASVERRTAERLSKKEIIRCLKRYIARELYALLPAPSRPLALDKAV
jgi:Staphylococcal nuclease homologue